MKSRLRVIDEIIELAPVVEGLARQVSRRSPELANQIRRAWPRVACNAGESLHRMGRKRTNRLDDAMGEARETHTALRYAAACGFITNAEPVIDRIDKVTATLYKLAHRPSG
ncbi:MAG: four helix bundle protein [Deltaproteobacteria bacterium]|nr:four helix bundle protein [Deltaproteobacteria bacterium]